MNKITLLALAALALISAKAGADIINVNGDGLMLDQPISYTLREAMDGMSDELHGLILSSPSYGQHKIRMSKTFTNFSWIPWGFSGYPGLGYYSADFQWGYAVDFEDATAQSAWLSKINNLTFDKSTTNAVLSNSPALGQAYRMYNTSISINTLPSSSLDGLAPLIARDTHYYQVRMSATVPAGFSFSELEFLDHVLNDLINPKGTYASRDSGLSGSATEAEIAAYARANYISGYDMRMEFDTIGDAAGNYTFEAVYTFWHSEEATAQVTADLDAVIPNWLYVFQNSIGIAFTSLTNQQSSISRGVAVSCSMSDFSYDPTTGAAEVLIKGNPSLAYILVEADDLDFSNPDQSPASLTGATVGNVLNDVVTTDSNGDATVQFNLGTSKPSTFVRGETAP